MMNVEFKMMTDELAVSHKCLNTVNYSKSLLIINLSLFIKSTYLRERL